MSVFTMTETENNPTASDLDPDLSLTPTGMTADVDPTRSEGREPILSASFLGLLVTQFLTSLNDNIFRWLIVPIGKEMVSKYTDSAVITASTVVAIGAIMLVLPFLLFAAPAAYLADRFSKRNVIVACKIAEFVFMAMGIASILLGSITMMFGVLFLMGVQSALLSPSKYGSIPEIVRGDKISAANALIAMTTIVAIVLGTMAGGYLYDWTQPLGMQHWWLWAETLLGVSIIGLVASLIIRPLRSANPQRAFPWNIAGESYRDLRTLIAVRPLFLAAVGTMTFWSLGGLCQVNVDRLVTSDMNLLQKDVGPLLGVLALGVGIGNVLAGVLSAGKIKLGMVPFGAFGIAASAVLLCFVPSANGSASSTGYILSGVLLFTLGLSAGFYDVPLQSYLQYRSDPKVRGSIIAASNFLTFAGTVAASGLFAVLTGKLLDFSGRTVFLIAGLGILPVAVIGLYLLAFDFTHFTCWLVSKLLYRVKIEGLENVPKEGALIVANHVSWADGFLLGLACPRHVRMVVFADYFERWWSRWFARLAKTILIHPGKRSIVESLRTAREALQAGELVGVFPEGGITRTGETQAFQPGIMLILKDTGRPVIPAHLGGMWGSIFSFEGGRFFWKLPKRWRYPMTIRFGSPIYDPKDVDEVRQAVISLGSETDGGHLPSDQ